MLKRWHCAFNLEKEHIRYIHLWVLLPGCLLVLWSLEAFKEIGNAIDKFLYVDSKHLTRSDRRMEELLVEVDLYGGISDEIDIVWRGIVIQQRLDYIGVPFRCVVCKETRHLQYQCNGHRGKTLPDWDDEGGEIEMAI
jgi:hypothetical protein